MSNFLDKHDEVVDTEIK